MSWPTPRTSTSGKNHGVTKFHEIQNRGHSLTIDDGWQQVAETALAFVRRFA
jgi:non-heme chloroperoxidase